MSAEFELDLVVGDVELHRLVVVFQQALQFENRFARNDDFLARKFLVGCDLAKRQTVAIGGDGHHVLAIDDEQQAIEVIANVLLRHREVHHIEQVLQCFLRQRDGGVVLLGLRDRRKFFCGPAFATRNAIYRIAPSCACWRA